MIQIPPMSRREDFPAARTSPLGSFMELLPLGPLMLDSTRAQQFGSVRIPSFSAELMPNKVSGFEL